MPGTITTRRFNVHEYHRMSEAGVLRHGDREELLDGEVVVMAAIGSPHQAAVDRLNRLLTKACDQQIVRVQGPVRLDEWNEPRPDLAILRPRDDFYASGHPSPGDVLLLIEVADTSLRFDREVKLPLYARAGIVECWIVDLNGRCVEVHRDPGPGGYGRSRTLARGESVSPAELPDLTFCGDRLLEPERRRPRE